MTPPARGSFDQVAHRSPAMLAPRSFCFAPLAERLNGAFSAHRFFARRFSVRYESRSAPADPLKT
jgi:hypothetical protein